MHHGGWGGAGGALIGGLIGSALGNGGGLFGGNNNNSGGANAIETQLLSQQLGAIQSSIPTTAMQTTAAVTASSNDITQSILNQSLGIQTGFQSIMNQTNGQSLGIQQAISQQSIGILNGFSGIKDAIASQNVGLTSALGGINQNILLGTATVASAVASDGDKTRALITSQYEATLNRELAQANAEIIALQTRTASQANHDALNFTVTNNATATQAQAQGQQQAQMQNIFGLLNGIVPALNNLTQIAHATNSNVIVGNSGATTTGAMTASPTNVNAH
jgi:hypothetical protein